MCLNEEIEIKQETLISETKLKEQFCKLKTCVNKINDELKQGEKHICKNLNSAAAQESASIHAIHL